MSSSKKIDMDRDFAAGVHLPINRQNVSQRWDGGGGGGVPNTNLVI